MESTEATVTVPDCGDLKREKQRQIFLTNILNELSSQVGKCASKAKFSFGAISQTAFFMVW